MNRTAALVLAIFLVAFAANAQDVITIGTGSAPAGGVASVPVSILDRSGTPLGSDAGTGNRIQGIAFKVMYPTSLVASVTFTRAGVTASLTPVFESTLGGGATGFVSYIVAFQESTNPIPFTLNAPAPGDLIGTLNVTLQPSATNGSNGALTFDAPSTLLSNQAGTTSESAANGNLALVNGSVSCTLSAPSNLVAQASGTSQVNLTWTAAGGADHYEVWRSLNGAAYSFLSNAPSASLSDMSVAASITYLYIVRAIDGSSNPSAFSNVDAATTIVFTDDPLVAMSTTVKAVHITQLRTAVNAFRASASLPPLSADPTIGVGQVIRAQHLLDLRTGLDAARSIVGVPAISYSDPTLSAGSTPVRGVHVQQLRTGVK